MYRFAASKMTNCGCNSNASRRVPNVKDRGLLEAFMGAEITWMIAIAVAIAASMIIGVRKMHKT